MLVWPDILGPAPGVPQMGKRLAESGYSVLVVNPFYRGKRAPVVPEGASFNDGDSRHRDAARAGAERDDARDRREGVRRVARHQPSVDKGRRSARRAIAWAARSRCARRPPVADRVGAGASFHGGGLVTQNPDSPHLLVPQMKAQFLFAIAENDDKREPDAKNVLRETFAKANSRGDRGVPSRARLVPARLGGVRRRQAERAWSRMLVLFESALA